MGGGLDLARTISRRFGQPNNARCDDWQQFIYNAKQMGRRSWGSCKAFAVRYEKIRAKHEFNNTAVAGCVTGGAMSAMGGPKAACIGCRVCYILSPARKISGQT